MVTNDVKTAYKKALKELEQVPLENATDFRIEQFEYDPNEKGIVEIIVSFFISKSSANQNIMTKFLSERVYKKIKFTEKGEVKGVYIYNPQ